MISDIIQYTNRKIKYNLNLLKEIKLLKRFKLILNYEMKCINVHLYRYKMYFFDQKMYCYSVSIN